MLRRYAIPFLIIFGLATYTYALSGCATATPTEQLASAVKSAHRAAAAATRRMAANATAAAEAAQERAAALASSRKMTMHDALLAGGVREPDLVQVELAQLTAASSRYEQLVAGEGWQERLVPLLREALDAYIRLRELGLPLPEVPPIVIDLLQGCD